MAGKISHDLDYLSAQEQLEHEIDYAEWLADIDESPLEMEDDENFRYSNPEEFDEYFDF